MSALYFHLYFSHENEEDFAKQLDEVKQTNDDSKKKVLNFTSLRITHGMVRILKDFLINDRSITGISFYGPKMTLEIWKEIIMCLMNHEGSKSLFFSSIRFTLEGFNYFCELISQKDIVELNIENITKNDTNSFFEKSDAQCILSAISKNKKLKKISLKPPNDIRSVCVNLSTIYAALISLSHIRKVCFSYASLSFEIKYDILRSLRNNTHLKVLKVYEIGFEDAQEICDSLSNNHCLREISIIFPYGYPIDYTTRLSMLVENGSVTEAFISDGVLKEQTSEIIERNNSMHKKAHEAAQTILAIQRRFKSLFIFPKDMTIMLGKYLLKTKTDIQAWGTKSQNFS